MTNFKLHLYYEELLPGDLLMTSHTIYLILGFPQHNSGIVVRGLSAPNPNVYLLGSDCQDLLPYECWKPESKLSVMRVLE